MQNLTPAEFEKMQAFVSQAFDFARCNDAPSLKIMLENGLNPNLANHKGDTLLMLASYRDSEECVRLLIKHGADIDKPNDRGHTPLAGVCFKGHANIAKILLDAGANPQGFEGSGGALSPINTALIFRRKAILRLLLSHTKLSKWQKFLKFISFS